MQPATVQPAIVFERAEHVPAVRDILVDAFETPAEADLVEALRDADALQVALVAELDGVPAGYIAFSPVHIETPDGRVAASGMAPVAVTAAMQGRGVGAALIVAGLSELRRAGIGLVVVLGWPKYYPRFGFQPAHRFGLRWEHDAPAEAFMALEVLPGAASGLRGVVGFHPAFDGV